MEASTSSMTSSLLSNSLTSSSPYATLFSTRPSSTAVAPSTPSNYLLHSPPYYVAIVLGTVAGVAFLASLTAWAIRRQAHERHRRLADSAAKLPWVSSGGENDDNDGFGNNSVTSDVENGMHTTPTEMGIMNLGSREDMAYVQSWEPRGDRDVGEPKRSELHEDDSKWNPPFINQQIPSYALFSKYSDIGSSRADRASLGSIDPHFQAETLGKGSALLITNQVPGDISASSSQEAGLPCLEHSPTSPLPEVGTPRELVPMPRFLGLDGRGLSVPWHEKNPSIIKPKSRIMSAGHIRETWERQASDEPEREGWANSIRSNLVNVFNVVTAQLPIAAIKDGKENPGSNFTPARPRRSSKRTMQVRSSHSEDEAKPASIFSRGCSMKASSSDPWSLVKTGSNVGIVNFHLPASDVCSVLSHDLSDPGFGLARSYTLHSAKPLRVEKKASMSLFKGCVSIPSKGSTNQTPFSRTFSAGGSVSPKRHRKSAGCSIKRKITSDRRSGPLFSRTTSMASSSSTVSVVTGAEDIREKRLLAREALKDRRRKAKRLKETSIG